MWSGFFTGEIAEVGIAASEQFRVSSYGFFSFWHIMAILFAFSIFGGAAVLFFRRKKQENLVLGLASIIVVACMLGTIIYSLATGIYNLEWFIPLHICNAFGLILPISYFSKKARAFFLNYIVWLGIGGGIVAIVFPITTMVYLGVFNTASILVWIHHVAIAVLGIYYIFSGLYHKQLNLLPPVGILAGLVAVSALVNHYTGANFMFINPDRMVEPLTSMTVAFGRFGVLITIGIILTIGILIHFSYKWLYKRKHLTLREFAMKNWFIRRVAKSEFLAELIKKVELAQNSPSKYKSLNLLKKFVGCVKESNILTLLFDTKLGNLTEADYLIETFKQSGLLKILADEFSLKELNDFAKLNIFEHELLLLPAPMRLT